MDIKALDLMHHGRKMKISIIEIDEIQWGDTRAI
jgi:hypothetical protein